MTTRGMLITGRMVLTALTSVLAVLIVWQGQAARVAIHSQRWLAVTAQVIYVDKDAAGANTGVSWTNAYTKLQSALDWTNAHGTSAYEIWVAEGVYYPDEGGSHVNDAVTETFRLNWNNVQLYGGFAGNETLRAQRNWVAHPTVLSGDIDQSGTPAGNAYHVLYLDGVTNQPITAAAVLDGFIITGGYANGGGFSDFYGGGLYCAGQGNGHGCSPTLAHLVFSGNFSLNGGSLDGGGGLYNSGYNGGVSSPVLTDVTFSGNAASGGGAMLNDGRGGGVSSPTLVTVTFSGNVARLGGGGMGNDGVGGVSSPVLTNVTFSGNSATFGGGGMSNIGDDNGVSSPVLTNVTFSGNTAYDSGGGMYNSAEYGASSPKLTNVTFSGNTAYASGGGMYSDGHNGLSSPMLTNVTFSGNSASDSGGGMYNNGGGGGVSSPALTNVTFSGNSATNNGGGMYNNGRSGGVSNPTLTNVLFSGNSAGTGGGMYNDGTNSGASSPLLTNSTLGGNAATSGGAMYNDGTGGVSSPMLVNSILWGNTAANGPQIHNVNAMPTITYSDVQWSSSVYSGTGNLNTNPRFVAPITGTVAPTMTGNYRVQLTSPVIDAGNNLSVTVVTDLDGNPRFVDVSTVADTGNGTAPVVDMGAYETKAHTVYLPVVLRTAS